MLETLSLQAYLADLVDYVSDKDFSVNASKSGTTEPQALLSVYSRALG